MTASIIIQLILPEYKQKPASACRFICTKNVYNNNTSLINSCNQANSSDNNKDEIIRIKFLQSFNYGQDKSIRKDGCAFQ